jgi:hypothetical protein
MVELISSGGLNDELPPPPPTDDETFEIHEDFEGELVPPPPVGTEEEETSGAEGQFTDPEPGVELYRAVALYDYNAEMDDELPFEKDMTIVVQLENEDGWLGGRVADSEGTVSAFGMFPGNYVERLA